MGIENRAFEIKATVLGSFRKAKPEIDLAIEELRDYGINVLGPDTGSVILPKRGDLYLPYPHFAPLESEQGMTPEEVERLFIETCVTKSDFVLVVNPNGYIGEMASYEIQVANSRGITIYYSREPIHIANANIPDELALRVRNLSIKDIVRIEQEARSQT
ncbi:MAG: hypothetical protein AAB532_02250 [Patescibacteria group bacterium]